MSDGPQGITQERIAAIMPEIAGSMGAELVDYECVRLSGGEGSGLGGTQIFRYWGHLRDRDCVLPWTLILKVLSAQNDLDPADLFYWKREFEVYRSGWLADLRGPLVAPHCYGLVELSDEQCAIWLEDVASTVDKAWDLGHYSTAAHHLGQFNGGYATAARLPDWPWLIKWFIRKETARADPGIQKLREVWRHPNLSPMFPGQSSQVLFRLWDASTTLVSRLDRMPQTICHYDAFRRNLFLRTGPDGQAQTVAIDWALVGSGPLGAELASLVWVSLAMGKFDASRASELGEAVFDSYLAGLSVAGWHGDATQVRFGYAAATCLRRAGTLGYILPLPDSATEVREPEDWQEDFNRGCAAMAPFFDDLADEALALMDRV